MQLMSSNRYVIEKCVECFQQKTASLPSHRHPAVDSGGARQPQAGLGPRQVRGSPARRGGGWRQGGQSLAVRDDPQTEQQCVVTAAPAHLRKVRLRRPHPLHGRKTATH